MRTRADRVFLSSLRAYLRPLSLSARISTRTLSEFPLRLSPFSLTFPIARGPVRDDWKEPPQSRIRVGLQDRAHVIQWEDTPVLL